jgi:hypothetical protein
VIRSPAGGAGTLTRAWSRSLWLNEVAGLSVTVEAVLDVLEAPDGGLSPTASAPGLPVSEVTDLVAITVGPA